MNGNTQSGAGPFKRRRKVSNDAIDSRGNAKKTTTHTCNQEPNRIKMAIVTDNFPSVIIGQEMVREIQGIVVGMLRATPAPWPVIDMSNVIGGALHVMCEGVDAAQWLQGLDGRVVAGITLKVINAKDLKILVKMSWRTKNVFLTDSTESLEFLQELNPRLTTTEWKVVDMKIEGNYIDRIVLMDEKSADVIKEVDYKPAAGLDRACFKLLDEMDCGFRDAAWEDYASERD